MNTANFSQKSYDGGLNDTATPLDINRDEASLLRNWDITFEGELKRRDGLTLVGTFAEYFGNTDTLTITSAVTVTRT